MTKFSIYAGVSRNHSIEERIAAIAEAGFDAVCLDFEKELAHTETSWENQLCLAEKYALPVENVHLTGKGMTSVWSDGEEGDQVITRLMDELRHMASLGIKTGVAHVTWGHTVPDIGYARGIARYQKAVEVAEKYGVILAIENSVYAPYVHTLLSNIKSPSLGFCYDSGHENAFTPTEDYLSQYGNLLVAMHLHDNDGTHDNHFLPLHKDGTICWEEKVRQLKKTKLFHEMITLESGIEGEVLLDGFRQALTIAKKIAVM
ncbi:MAG: sugar phosphate isomerase/epimerase [Clostridia bacterium]|nr:sugar phosphate isomerase/epimerase [Clostridia bacterium]